MLSIIIECELHDGFRCLCEILVVKGEPPEVLLPDEGVLDDPPIGQYVEPGRAVVRPEDDLEVPSDSFRHPVREPSAIAAESMEDENVLSKWPGVRAVVDVTSRERHHVRGDKIIRETVSGHTRWNTTSPGSTGA